MKMFAAYFENAIGLTDWPPRNPKPKAEFEKQAEAYRKLASERASKLGLPAPPNDTN